MMGLTIPEFTTDRLRLRAYREDDLDALATFMADDRSQYVGGPKTRDECWRMLSSLLGHWALRGYGMWLVAEKDTDAPVGSVGIINPEGWDEPELGWSLFNGSEGKGYGTEAAVAARAYAATHFGIPAPISYIDPRNTASLALAKRIGATFEREGAVMGKPCHVYRHPKAEVF